MVYSITIIIPGGKLLLLGAVSVPTLQRLTVDQGIGWQ